MPGLRVTPFRLKSQIYKGNGDMISVMLFRVRYVLCSVTLVRVRNVTILRVTGKRWPKKVTLKGVTKSYPFLGKVARIKKNLSDFVKLPFSSLYIKP